MGDLLKEWHNEIKSLNDGEDLLNVMKKEWFERKSDLISQLRNDADRQRSMLLNRGKIVPLEKYNMIAIARNLTDVDFYVKIPNSWTDWNWKELLYSAIKVAMSPLHLNISRGFIAASKASLHFKTTDSLTKIEQYLEECM